MKYRRLATLKTAQTFADYLAQTGVDLPFDTKMQTGPDAPLAKPYVLKNGFSIGNRFAILPMEGWDGTQTGHPTDLTVRRWKRFVRSGAKLIWGGKAVAVQPDARASPNQLLINHDTVSDLATLREKLIIAHAENFDRTDDLLVGLQLTHSGRFTRPNIKSKLEPKSLYHHPLLDPKFGTAPNLPLIADDEIAALIADFIKAAQLAYAAGFAFVDVKHCHGYLGHEFLSAFERPGPYGGSFENRTHFLREIVAGIRETVPGLDIGVRFSACDFVPFRPSADGTGEPAPFKGATYDYAFGNDGSGVGIDLTEPQAFLDLLAELDIQLVCVTVGSPYYNPHIQRPAPFPPSDGYQPPEDPLAGVARQIATVARLKQHRPELAYVGSGYSYLQEWLPNVGQHVVGHEMADFVGLGRIALSYPELAADTLTVTPLDRRRICRTFSDCTTAPRKGLVSDCYPLDHFYQKRPAASTLKEMKKTAK